MRVVKYKVFVANKGSGDPERAVLPTILFARQSAGMASSMALAVGWWAWGIGIIRTVVDGSKTRS